MNATPRRFYLQARDPYSLHRRLVEPQGLSGRMQKFSPPTGFDPRTVQPIVNLERVEQLNLQNIFSFQLVVGRCSSGNCDGLVCGFIAIRVNM